MPRPFHHTKIVATLGPATDAPGVLERCFLAGLSIARLNGSHGTTQEHAQRVKAVRSLSKKYGRPIGILMDLPGPKFRLGSLPATGIELPRGREILLSGAKYSSGAIPVHDISVLRYLQPGHNLYLADGSIKLEIIRRIAQSVQAKVLVGGRIRSGSGLNFPDTLLNIQLPTAEDRRCIEFAKAQGLDWIGISFVQTANDVSRVRRTLSGTGKHRQPLLIAKIEKASALRDLEAIVKESDGIMVARGDLGVETPLEEVPMVQKRIIAEANRRGRPVITATQMLESMVEHRWPTRAEVTDVANAVLDGTDAVMLSAETAIGQYPSEAVAMLRSVSDATEAQYPYRQVLERLEKVQWDSATDALSLAACRLAADIRAAAIVIAGPEPAMAFGIARFRPSMPIFTLGHSVQDAGSLILGWGINPLAIPRGLARSPVECGKYLRLQRWANKGSRLIWITPSSLSKKGNSGTVQTIQI